MSDYEYADKIDSALQYLRERYGEEGLQYRSVLALGCGTGDMMPRFSGSFSSVTGLEQDEENCDKAMELILDSGLENATALCMDLEEYIREFPNQTFDVVLCCCAYQNDDPEQDFRIPEDLKHVIGPDSVCLFEAPFAEGRGRFSRPWAERLLQSYGLKTKLFRQTGEESAVYLCEPAEGTLLRRSCGPETASGKVCFMRFYYLNGSAGMNTAKLRNFIENEAEDADEVREAFETAENYLFQGNAPFAPLRHYRKAEVRCEKAAVADSHIIVTFYPENGVAQVGVCLTLEDAPCDNFVYLQKIRSAEEALFTVEGQSVSIPQLCEDVLKDCGLRNLKQGPASAVIELNRFGSCADPAALSADDLRCLYGMLTGDEAYLHIPASYVEQRMANSWSGLDFVRVFADGDSFLLLNFNRGETYADYIDYRIPYAERYLGGLDEYFTMDAPTAGVDHGLFFSVEKGQVTCTLAQRLEEEVRRNGRSREELFRAAGELERGIAAEPGTQDSLVFRELGAADGLENVRGMLEQAASEQDLRYGRSTNRMVAVLTILGLVYALIRIIGSF